MRILPSLMFTGLTLIAQSGAAQQTTRTFQASCDAVWPHAIQVFLANGFGVKASDRQGGVLALEYQRGQSVSKWGTVNKLIGQYTRAKSTGFWTAYKGFAISGANAIAVPDGNGCRYQLGISYQGWEHRLSGEGWWVLESNGSFERQMLDEIAARLPAVPKPEAAKESVPAESKTEPKPEPKPPEQSKTEASKGEAPKPAPAPEHQQAPSETRVVRLPG